jgi:hypothetical protein
LIWFGYIARLSQWGGGGAFYLVIPVFASPRGSGEYQHQLRLKNWKYKDDMPPTPLLFSMDGWLGEPTDTLHWRFSTALCLFDLEICLVAPPSSIFFISFFCCTKVDGERKKRRLISRLPFIPVIFFLVWFGFLA